MRPPWRAYASLAASMATVGGYVALAKLLVAVFPVMLLAWLRFGIAAVAMAGWLRRPPQAAPLARRERRLLFLESFFGNFLFSICMLAGVALTSAVAAGVAMAGIPAAVALLARIFLGERLSRRGLAGIVCGAAGVALLAVAGGPPGAGAAGWEAWAGPLLLVGATFCEAAYVVIGRRLAASVDARRISAIMNLWGLALTTPFGIVGAASFDFAAVGAGTWALFVVYALAASVATVWLWMNGIAHVPASAAGVYTVLLPLTAAAVGVLALGEPFGALHAAAFALATGGVVLATTGISSAAPRSSAGARRA